MKLAIIRQFLFFLIDKKELGLGTPRRGENNTHEVYNQMPKKLGKKKTKNISSYLTNNHFIKLIIDKV